ncbi:MAG: large conductance mechanosensitive channel protein MscL [Dermatophilaceae bacterium]
MKNAWTEFKAFAMGGNMFDLALGFIIGAAFASLVESLAGNLIMPLVGAVFGQPSFDDLSVMVRGAEVPYGKFLTQLLSFILLALVLFGLVKLLKRAGLGNFRAQGQAECPYCKEFVSVDALKCKWCTADIDPELVEEEDAEILAARRRAGE